MDEGTFPRRAIRPDYDLIYANPKPGDRILKDDDSFLFVETLQAAGQHLHLSYVGADQNTDARKLPSILIQQLAEMLDTTHEDLSIKHRLHPFNEKYFGEDDLKTYSGKHYEIASKIYGEEPSIESEFIDIKEIIPVSETKIISANNLISFFTHPCKYMAEYQLDVRDYDRFNEIESRELFKLKGLDRYKLDDLLFRQLAENKDAENVFEYVKTGGMIPASLPGEKLFNQEKESMKLLVEALEERTSTKLESVEINFKSGERQIIGNISGISDKVLISYRVGKRRARHEIEHWLKHLLLLQNGNKIQQSLYMSVKDNKVDILNINTEKIPQNTFIELVKWYSTERLTKSDVTFFPESSKAYAAEYLKSSSRDEAIEKAKKEWVVDKYKPFAESADYYNKLIWRNDNPLNANAFHKYALLFWEPFFKSVEEEA
jgi:exodeoxyribonuclease V gamma subunit